MSEREAASLAAVDSFFLDDWLIEPSTGLVSRGTQSARLEPKVMQVLLCLAGKAGRTVSRDQLMAEAWDGAIVSEDAVNRCVSRLRKIFSGTTIETVPKIGYRLRGEVSRVKPTPVPSDSVNGATEPAKVTLALPAPGSPTPAPAAPGPARLAVPAPRILFLAFALLLVLSVFARLAVTSRKDSAADPGSFRILPLTSLPGHEIMPSFSPDGDHVAFGWKGPQQDNWDIYIKPVGREEILRLTSDRAIDTSPAWSPRGNEIAFVRRSESRSHLTLVSSVGGVERRVASYRAGNGSELSWTPDGGALAFSGQAESGGPSRIFLIRISDGAIQPLTEPPSSSIGDEYPAISPDGAHLAFVRTQALGVSDLYLLDRSAGSVQRLTRDNLKVHGVAWQADGKSLIFSSNRRGSFGLWRVRLDQSLPEPLPFSGRNADWVTVSRDGRRTAYEEWLGRATLVRIDLTAKDPSPEPWGPGSTRFDWAPEFSPDGNRLAFISDRSGAAEVWVSDLEGKTPLQITRFGGPYTKTVRWSPDGRRLAVTAPPYGQFDIFVAEADGSGLHRLTTDSSDDFAPAWSPDGRMIYFGSKRSGSWQIWAMRADGATPRQVTREGGKAPQLSSDGRWLFYCKEDQPGIWKRDLTNPGTDEIIVSDLEPVDWNNWEVSEGRVYYVTRPVPNKPQLVALDLASGHLRRLTALPELYYDSGISLHGGQLLLSKVIQNESDLVLVEGRER
ncbi:MAG: hypothetical protein EHM23_33195 [Acidobacteria bacterium]|nr:MAG: hypothetical protein EHM23_33195 [Acidobacteriota bacterium]